MAHHQGLPQDVGLQLEFIEPVLDRVPDAYEAGQLATFDHGQGKWTGKLSELNGRPIDVSKGSYKHMIHFKLVTPEEPPLGTYEE